MRHVSVADLEKFKTINFSHEAVRSTVNHNIRFNINHDLFDYITKHINDYMYYVRFTGTVWRKTKYKDYYEYYDEDSKNWVYDEEMNNGYLDYMDFGESMTRLTA